jgi:hypothetical protein
VAASLTLTRNSERCDWPELFLAHGDSNIFDTSAWSALNQQASKKIPATTWFMMPPGWPTNLTSGAMERGPKSE